jgi:rhodanese-related sulfurtransferase
MKHLIIVLSIIFVAFFSFIAFSNYCVACGCVVCKSDNFVSSDVIQDVSVNEFNDILSENDDVVLIDIRTLDEFYSGHIENALNIDFYSSSFRNELDSLDKNKTYLIYCRTGSRTMQASRMMRDLGFEEVYVLEGGINAWVRSGFPVVYS